MWSQAELRPSVLLLSLGAAVVVASCSRDAPTGVDEEQLTSPRASADMKAQGQVSVCHRSGSTGTIVSVSKSDLAAHTSQGDYITGLVVSHRSGQPDDGAHFHSIGDAIAAARAGRFQRGETTSAACRITISVSGEVYRGTATVPAPAGLEQFPLVVDVPDITLHGALVMKLDAAGRATGRGVGPGRTTIRPVDGLPFEDITGASVPLIIANRHPGGSAGDGFVVEGFVLTSGHRVAIDFGGQGVFSTRVGGLVIRGNVFDEGFSESIDLRETSAIIERNHLFGTGGTCDMCLAGPGTFRVTGNVLLAGGIPGILTVPAIGTPNPSQVEPMDVPVAATVNAEITNNEVRDHLRIPVGAGIRVAGIGIGAKDVRGTMHAVVQDNLLVHNRFALMVEAAFPAPDAQLKADIDVTFGGNDIRRSCQANLLVALTRHTRALGLTDFPYLENSTYRLALRGDVLWKDVWYGHEAGHGNTLIVNGKTIPNGTRQFYSPFSCPALRTAPSMVALGEAGAP